jgi:uncharacterized protein with NAD-binding domain and iron-sulfur cluster
VTSEVAGFVPGDIVEHGLHAWFQHYVALYGLMERAGVPKPPFAGSGVHLWHPAAGHLDLAGGPGRWLVSALGLPHAMRGSRAAALVSFGRMLGYLDHALSNPTQTDLESAQAFFARMRVPQEAVDAVFAPCLYSLTSLPLTELSALEMLRWMAAIVADPRLRCLAGGPSTSMTDPIMRYLSRRGAEFRLGVEVTRLSLGADGRVRVELDRAPDRTGLRHILVEGFEPASPPDPKSCDAIVCSLPWERLRALCLDDRGLSAVPQLHSLHELRNIHPLTLRLWFDKPIVGAQERYTLTVGTLFDVMRPTTEPERYPGIRLIDALVEDVQRHLPELGYQHESFVGPGPMQDAIVARVTTDLERMFPGQIVNNSVARRFVHSREGIVACQPGVWEKRPTQHVGIPNFVLAGDWTRQGWGVCMEGAVRSGQLAVDALLGRTARVQPETYEHLVRSVKSLLFKT